jgi:crossover junction endodeoxyribonuclease RuvC
MVTISIDPGYERVGIAVVEKEQGKKEVLLFSECFKTKTGPKLHERIFLVGEEVERIIKKYQPERFAIESVFHTNNTKTVLGVAEARGAMIYVANKHNLVVSEYTPLQIKNAVTGYGRATKDQVYSMVSRLVSLPSTVVQDDEIDAIAIGITDLASSKDINK